VIVNPFPPGDSRTADTFDPSGLAVRKAAHEFCSETDEILDVGPGFGKYHFLLPEYTMDACEIWEPTVEKQELRSLYRHIYVQDICDLVISPEWKPYRLVIMGDVFEHIERDKAKKVISTILETCGDIFIVTPYECPQGIEDHNPYQIHIQDDLTPEIMDAEFPDLKRFRVEWRDSKLYKGIYRRRHGG
jgi:hypothetical protein